MEKVNDNKKLFLRLLFAFLISRAIFVVIYFITRAFMGTGDSFEAMFGRWDALRYMNITDYGYSLPVVPDDPQNNWAFFPLYPLVCMGLKFITFGLIPTFYVGMIVANVCIFAAAFLAIKTIRLMGLTKNEREFYERPNPEGSKAIDFFNGIFKDGMLLGWFLFMGPFTMYMGTMYTESMYIFFIVLSFYLMKKKQFLLAGFLIIGAGLTRNMGVLLVVPLLIEMYLDWRHTTGRKNVFRFLGHIFATPVKLLAVLVTPIGTFSYMLFLYFFCGDAFAFKNVQIAWRTEEHFPIVGVLLDAISIGSDVYHKLLGWICIGAIAIFIYMLVRRLYSEAVFGGLTLAVPLTSAVMSTPRFISGDYVVWIGAYDIIARQNHAARVATCIILAGIELVLTFMWMSGNVGMI